MPPLDNFHFIAFDTETTGLSPVVGRIVELSAVRFKLDGSEHSTFSTLIDPDVEIPEEVTAIHGITNDMVQGAPKTAAAIADFLNWLEEKDAVLVAHNAGFDVGFLHVAIAKCGLPLPGNFVLDTFALSRKLVPESPNYQLRTLIEHLKLPQGGFHRAMADSYHVKELLIELVKRAGADTAWEDLAILGNAFPFAKDDLFEEVGSLPRELEPIQKAITAGLAISITYKGVNPGSGPRLVTPQAVHSWRGNFYLHGFCHKSGADRTFRIDKILDIKVIGQ